MYKIKLEPACEAEQQTLEENQVVIYYKVNTGNYNQKQEYKINLSEKSYSCFEQGEEVKIDWSVISEDIDNKIDEFKVMMKQRIMNNNEIIYSAFVNGDEKEVSKAKTHLEKNKIILEYLKEYK